MHLRCICLSADATAALPDDCVAAQQSGAEAWRCFTAPTVAPFIKSPLFVLQSQFDHFQLSAMGKIPCAEAQAYFPPWSNNTAAVCSEADLVNISAYGAGWFQDFRSMLKLPKLGRCANFHLHSLRCETYSLEIVVTGCYAQLGGYAQYHGIGTVAHCEHDTICALGTGAFITACVAHEERGTAGWTGLQAAGTVLRDAFHAWHTQQEADAGAALTSNGTQWIDSCELPCNNDASVCAPIK
jgi:hypothetical protein